MLLPEAPGICVVCVVVDCLPYFNTEGFLNPVGGTVVVDWDKSLVDTLRLLFWRFIIAGLWTVAVKFYIKQNRR